LIFSLIFGAGAIFVLAWNASVIAAAIGIFTKSELSSLPIALIRYMIHGIPEIASYFIVALAGAELLSNASGATPGTKGEGGDNDGGNWRGAGECSRGEGARIDGAGGDSDGYEIGDNHV